MRRSMARGSRSASFRFMPDERGASSDAPLERKHGRTRINPVVGGLVIGGLVLGAATIWGAVEIGFAAFVTYRLFRRRRPLRRSAREALGEAVESAAGRIAKILLAPAPGPAMVLRAAEIASAAYLGFRLLKRRRAASRARQLPAAPRVLQLPAGSLPTDGRAP